MNNEKSAIASSDFIIKYRSGLVWFITSNILFNIGLDENFQAENHMNEMQALERLWEQVLFKV